jgi:hypothetical protein
MPITISKADSHHGFPLLTILTLLLKGNFPTVKISHISIIMYAMRKTCISLDSKMSVAGPKIMDFHTYLLPTAACFLSDLQKRNAETTIASPARSMEPIIFHEINPSLL